jgi:hypothetical protein
MNRPNPAARRRADLERPLVERLEDVLKLAEVRDLGDDHLLVAMVGQEHDENGEPTGREVYGQIALDDVRVLVRALRGRA